jgi:FAD:protein FMN transferase
MTRIRFGGSARARPLSLVEAPRLDAHDYRTDRRTPGPSTAPRHTGRVEDRTFRAMGCTIRLVVGDRARGDVAPPAEAAEAAEAWIRDYDERLSRFKPGSELSRLNRDARETVPASPLLRLAVLAGVRAAQASGGLVDPCLLDALERSGYRESRAGVAPVPLAEALRSAPPRAPARPGERSPWRAFSVDAEAGTITRPPGARFDPGGVGKGLAADLLAPRLEAYERFAVDCAGDLRVGGPAAAGASFEVEVEHPLTRATASTLHVASGGIATSALTSRIWRGDDGAYAHHLLDPATGSPAWTGVLSATALAPTTVEAELRSKAALLSGPRRARELLRADGGVLVLDDGGVEAVGRAARPHIHLRVTPKPTS